MHYSSSYQLSLCPFVLAQTDPGATPIFIDELDARFLKCISDHLKSSWSRLTDAYLELVHGDDTHARSSSQLLLAPAEKAAGCSALR